ncbi:MAG: flavin reductase [Spirochaetaceae bacterium]|jgi:flavorubredoxin/flavin reductase (DIM6/NTAB) family NADH-FMN oxidoreductase RutF/rubredoxin|nr:flavin reductase [Spirochaetaceae bacterium]
MYQVTEITKDLFWVGASDRRIALFENVYPVPNGVSYNAYLWLGKETVLLDTVDRSVSGQFLENLRFLLGGRKLDYVIVNHLEPDHAATLAEVVLRYPEVTIVTNGMAAQIMKQFNDFDVDVRLKLVGEGDVLETDGRVFTFVRAQMVHWPEVMVTYERTRKVLFSADAFGTFGALNGNVFADEVNFERDYLDDARRYYTNIVGKYGDQVQALLAKAATLDIAFVCPLHGPVWRSNLGWYIDKYMHWSAYVPEESAVVIFYASIYGGTENAAQILAAKLGEGGVRNIKVYDVSKTHFSYVVSESFRASHLIFASPTYNAGMFFSMECCLHALAEHNLQNRTVAFIENGSWAPMSADLMRGIFAGMKNITVIDKGVSFMSSLKKNDLDNINALAAAVLESFPKHTLESHVVKEGSVDNAAFFKLSYGLYFLTARDGDKDNGCVINTTVQLTDTPKRVTIAVNKQNFTHDMILKTGIFNVSVLSQDVTFKAIQHFGFQSGRTVDKFADIANEDKVRSANDVYYLPASSNAFISGRVIAHHDFGTHTLFIADVTEAGLLNGKPSVTYQYYFDNIKPKPPVSSGPKKGWVCKICGYIHDEDDLPEDFICPLCKHGAADFEKL